MSKARYVMVGGFLGAGKTTAIARLARLLTEKSLRVGLITNDQGSSLVDTAMLRAQGYETQEIAGGCFCCRFNSLMEASKALADKMRPDVFIAEPVGSCTDLVATVTYPLRRLYGQEFVMAPLSVLVDPVRARRILGLDAGASFSEKVLYIYQKQLEEADVIVISKSDLLDPARLQELREAFVQKHPRAEVLMISARTGANLEVWLNHILEHKQTSHSSMPIDYDIYAEGEALLGWFNCTVQLKARRTFDSDSYLNQLARTIQQRLASPPSEIAHLKMTLSPDAGLGEIAAINLVRNDFVPELSLQLSEPVRGGQLMINLRAEAPPETLRSAVTEALATVTPAFPTLHAKIEHLEHFRPGRPTPTHRDSRATAER